MARVLLEFNDDFYGKAGKQESCNIHFVTLLLRRAETRAFAPTTRHDAKWGGRKPSSFL
jgi:hypothetical protein